MTEARTDEQESETLRLRITELESARATTTSKLESTTAERDKLRRAYDRLCEELELLRRRIFVAKAERVDTTQLELQFAAVKKELDALCIQDEHNDESEPQGDDKPPPRKPKGRRDLARCSSFAKTASSCSTKTSKRSSRRVAPSILDSPRAAASPINAAAPCGGSSPAPNTK